MSYNEGIRTFTASGAVTAHGRVKIATGTTTSPPQVALAGLGEAHIGVAEYAAADGETFAVKLRNNTVEVVANEAISIGAVLYGASAGKVADTSSGTAFGIALEAATAGGDIIEMVTY